MPWYAAVKQSATTSAQSHARPRYTFAPSTAAWHPRPCLGMRFPALAGHRPSVDANVGVLRQRLCALGEMRRLLHALRLRFAVTAVSAGSFVMAQPTDPSEACTNLSSGMIAQL